MFIVRHQNVYIWFLFIIRPYITINLVPVYSKAPKRIYLVHVYSKAPKGIYLVHVYSKAPKCIYLVPVYDKAIHNY